MPSPAPGEATQFCHDLTLFRPLGTERLLDNRDHPLCLSQGRSTRPCSGAPKEHPSPADARSKEEGVALPPIDVFKDGLSAAVPYHPRGPRRRPIFFDFKPALRSLVMPRLGLGIREFRWTRLSGRKQTRGPALALNGGQALG